MKRKGEILSIGELTQEILGQVNIAENEKSYIPKTDVWETTTAYNVHVYLPGLSSEEINLEYQNDFIVISGERRNSIPVEEDTHIRQIESEYGFFQRRIKLNDKADKDKIKARLEHGVLMISIQKHQAGGKITHSKVA